MVPEVLRVDLMDFPSLLIAEFHPSGMPCGSQDGVSNEGMNEKGIKYIVAFS